MLQTTQNLHVPGPAAISSHTQVLRHRRSSNKCEHQLLQCQDVCPEVASKSHMMLPYHLPVRLVAVALKRRLGLTVAASSAAVGMLDPVLMRTITRLGLKLAIYTGVLYRAFTQQVLNIVQLEHALVTNEGYGQSW